MTAPIPGAQLHWLVSGVSYLGNNAMGSGQVSRRGETITATSGLLEANIDLAGESLFDLDGPAQIEKYGRQLWEHGPWPDDLVTVTPNSIEEQLARELATTSAWAEPDLAERQRKLAEVRAKYGRARSTQRSSYIPSDSERDEELRRAGLK